VSFLLLPAIDLTEGRLGLFTPDGPVGLEAYAGDAVAAAVAMRAAGAGWLHIVDLDLAFTGRASGLEIVRTIAALEGVRVQASGGVRSVDHVDALRSAGASRIVVSSGALADERLVTGLLAAASPGELVIGIEVAQGRIRSRGADPVDLDLSATLRWLRESGADSFLVTAVARVGSGAGPDLEPIRRVVATGARTLAAGGIASLDDLHAVREAGAAGAVIGRAAVEGTIDLSAAFAWASASREP
jgi:phosphoribosylformimino-5-aminoimidazole carboxamide ribonucleotide (ProFAR) isomerase